RRKLWIHAIVWGLLVIILAACGGKDDAKKDGNDDVEKAPDPVELLLVGDASFDAGLSKIDLPAIVKEKYPHITLKLSTDPVDDLIAAGNIPNIVAVPFAFMDSFLDKDLAMDMMPLIKKYNFD